MRCVMGFFGITRSLQHTAEAIRTGFYQPLENAGISLLRVGHFNLPETIINPRSGEFGIAADRRESGLLDLDLCWIEPQRYDLIANQLEFARRFPDLFGDQYRSLANLCYQLHSLERLWSLLELVGVTEHDLVLLLRPDLLYLDRLNPAEDFKSLLDGRADLVVPAWQSWGGLNDRFAFCTGRAAKIYTTRLSLFTDACLQMGGMHAEGFLRFVAERHGLKVHKTDLRAVRVRANGRIAANDASMISLPSSPPTPSSDAPDEPSGLNAVTGAPGTSVDQPAATLSDVDETRPPCTTLRVSRVNVDGHWRVSPLKGLPYLDLLSKWHGRKQVRRYLEIGTQSGMSLACATGRCVAIDTHFMLDKAMWARKPGVSLFEMTSDDFFKANDPSDILGGPIDFAFIDGMHLSEFVLRDFMNVERHCSTGSIIALHDVLPMNYEMTERHRRPSMRSDRALAAAWTGDVWRVLPLLLRERPDLCIEVLDCPPTGLMLISNLDPDSRTLLDHQNEIIEALTRYEPTESEFWSFVQSLTVVSTLGMTVLA